MLKNQLGAVDIIFRDSDFDFEDPSVEEKTDCWVYEVLQVRCEAIATGPQPRERTFSYRGIRETELFNRWWRAEACECYYELREWMAKT